MKIILFIILIISFTGCTKNYTWEYDATNYKLYIDKTNNLPNLYQIQK